ncbi:NAD-dependent succinate-semialdehyde dehydrogenase [Motilimonas sp. KMU-193]|uniref:NAD-dependent succinate-semialdehyde dehydrogenase n=1 Tax=Motilimonas sp. KMU-193 TaxID=3388668 RepID=UPI00396B1FCB
MNFLQLNDNQLIKQANLIDGQWLTSNNSITVYNPATTQALGEIPLIDEQNVENTIHAALKSFNSYSKSTSYEKSLWLLKWYDLVLAHADDLAKILTQEQGKPLAEAKAEIQYAASFIQWFAEQIKSDHGLTLAEPVAGKSFATHKHPVGVAALITPWNFPAAMITRKAAAALAAGCTIIIKPSELTPFTAIALVELAQRAGFPDGAINLITGDAAMIGDKLCQDVRVKKLSFTGSTRVGQQLFQQSANNIKRLSLELGGNAPFIIFDDANLDQAISALIQSKFRNNGQTCVAANRIYVDIKLKQQLVPMLIERLKQLTCGNGLTEDVDLGPMINSSAVSKVATLVTDALAKGAQCVYQADIKHLGPHYYPATLLTEVNMQMAIANSEIFGPVLAIQWFSHEAEVISLANNTDAGLAAYFFSDNIHRCQRVANALDFGMVGINSGMVSHAISPFGGIKYSGIGREGGHTGLAEYQYIKAHCFGHLS